MTRSEASKPAAIPVRTVRRKWRRCRMDRKVGTSPPLVVAPTVRFIWRAGR
jgi:hypothetical protein